MVIGHVMRGTVLSAALMMACGNAWALDDASYPDMKGQWNRVPVPGIAPSFDPNKRPGAGQQAPLRRSIRKSSTQASPTRLPAAAVMQGICCASRPACRCG